MSGVKIQKIAYGGWDNCLQISNNIVDLVVTVDVGPRVIRYGFAGQENELGEIRAEMGMTGGSEWRMYGGHRLWISPESRERTYEPDNVPVKWKEIENGVSTAQEEGPETKVIKEMEITLDPDGPEVTINHRLTNKGIKSIELSAWAITIMNTGGIEIVPQTRNDTGLLPNRSIALWPYTSLDDSRIRLGNKFIILRQDRSNQKPLKFGTTNDNGWAAYFNNNHLFIKKYSPVKNATYPDFGVSYETYINDLMLEMETLSPLTMLGPGDYIDHQEKWELFDKIPEPSDNEESIEESLTGKVSI
jgi:hypothetical protein